MAALYGAAVALSAFVTQGATPAPVWFPAGVGLAGVLLLGYEMAPVIFVISLIGTMIVKWPMPLALAAAALTTLEGCLGAWLLERFRVRAQLDTVRDMGLLLVLGAVVAPLVVFPLGPLAELYHFGDQAPRWAQYLDWVFPDTLGIIAVAPLLLVLSSRTHLRPLNIGLRRTLVVIAIIVASAVVAVVPFTGWHAGLSPLGRSLMPVFVFPLVVVLALNFRQVGAALATLLISAGAAWGTVVGQGQFAGYVPEFGYVPVQLFLVVVGATALTLGSAMAERDAAAEALRGSEEKYRVLVERIPAVTYEAGHSAPSETEYVSPQIESMLGYTPQEWRETSGLWLDLVHPDDRDRVKTAMEVVPVEGRLDIRYRIRDKAGAYHWVADSAIRLRAPDGDLLAGSFFDVTEVEEAQRQTAESRAMYKATFEASAVGIAVADLDLTWTDVNPALARMLGYTPEELIGRKPGAFIVPEDIPEAREMLERLQDGSPGASRATQHMLRMDGSIAVMDVSLTPVRDPHGAITSYLGTVSDVTERERAAAELRSAEELFRTIVEGADDIIQRYDAQERLTYVNPATERFAGVSYHEHIGKHLDEVGLPEEIRDHQKRMFREVAKQRRPVEFEHVVPSAAGPRYVAFVVVPEIDAEGELTGYVTVGRDMTRRRQTELEMAEQRQALETLIAERTHELTEANERLRELDRLKSMFIASMSHELRTPLNSVIGFTGVMLSGAPGPLTEEQQRQLEMVRTAGGHLLQLVSEILDVSQVEAGTIRPQIERFDLADIEAEVLELTAPVMKERGLALGLDPVHVEMVTDGRRLMQCLLNLVSNAAKYTASGRVDVVTTLGEGEVSIEVRDTGVGIARKDIERAFEPFTRIETPLTASTPGTGLGLYITRRLAADVLGGTVELESALGEGSTFTLTVPIELDGHSASSPASEPPPDQQDPIAMIQRSGARGPGVDQMAP